MMSRRDSNIMLMLPKAQLDSESELQTGATGVSVFSLVLISSMNAVHVTFPTETGSTRTLSTAVHYIYYILLFKETQIFKLFL